MPLKLAMFIKAMQWFTSWKRAIFYAAAAVPLFMQKINVYFGSITGLLLLSLAFCYFLMVFRYYIDASCLARCNRGTQTQPDSSNGVDPKSGEVYWTLEDDKKYHQYDKLTVTSHDQK